METICLSTVVPYQNKIDLSRRLLKQTFFLDILGVSLFREPCELFFNMVALPSLPNFVDTEQYRYRKCYIVHFSLIFLIICLIFPYKIQYLLL